jgi:hypothetical protein
VRDGVTGRRELGDIESTDRWARRSGGKMVHTKKEVNIRA